MRIAHAWVAAVNLCLAVLLPCRSFGAEPVCAADVRKLCPDVPAGRGRIQACLQEREAEVSPACRARIDELSREAKTLAVACRWDIGRLCSDVTPGAARLVDCLKKNEADLSPVCLSQLRSLQE